jgi:hypothetical protein
VRIPNIDETALELALLWPALAGALERDGRPPDTERVSTSGSALSLPVNADVLRALTQLGSEIPATAAWVAEVLGQRTPSGRDILDHLRHLPVAYERLVATNAAQQAGRLARYAAGWLHTVKVALGLRIPDRRLGQYCPRHDDPLAELVAPGDDGQLRYRRTDADGRPVDAIVTWSRADAVLCRSCGVSWTPGQYLLLGRLLMLADLRRTTEAGTGVDGVNTPDATEAAA